MKTGSSVDGYQQDLFEQLLYITVFGQLRSSWSLCVCCQLIAAIPCHTKTIRSLVISADRNVAACPARPAESCTSTAAAWNGLDSGWSTQSVQHGQVITYHYLTPWQPYGCGSPGSHPKRLTGILFIFGGQPGSNSDPHPYALLLIVSLSSGLDREGSAQRAEPLLRGASCLTKHNSHVIRRTNSFGFRQFDQIVITSSTQMMVIGSNIVGGAYKPPLGPFGPFGWCWRKIAQAFDF